jgi:hypothetical protein
MCMLKNADVPWSSHLFLDRQIEQATSLLTSNLLIRQWLVNCNINLVIAGQSFQIESKCYRRSLYMAVEGMKDRASPMTRNSLGLPWVRI